MTRFRWLFPAGWLATTLAVIAAFRLAGAGDPAALPLIALLGAAVATLVTAAVVCLLKGRIAAGVTGLLVPAALPIAHFGAAATGGEGWAPTLAADLAAVGLILAATIALSVVAGLRPRPGSWWIDHSTGRPTTTRRLT